MLRHLGVTKARIIRVFALESGLLVAIGVGWGAALGAAIAAVLVHRVNPQSFHWTMDMHWPWTLLTASALGLIALGVLAAVLAARSAAGESPVRAVREDW
jgi:putative ABC transport system permease protein